MIKQSTLSDLDHIKHIQHVIGVKVRDSVPPIPHITELTIKNSLQFKNIEHLSHLNTFKILHRNKLKDLSPLRNIENILIQECCRVRDFSMFHSNRQRSLRLFYCPYLTNLENFRMIRCVVISGWSCESLVDVSPLYGVYDLSFINCYCVEDISGLGNHYRLNLDGCHINKGFKSLFNIPYISLYSSILKDLTPLRAAKSVTLRRCDEVVDISPLFMVSTVIIQNCRLIIDPTPLQNIPNLSLIYGDTDYCQINYTQLANLKNHSLTLSLYLTNTIQDNSNDYQFFRLIQHLTITGSTLIDVNMNVFNFIHHLQSITIIDCNIKHVNGFNKIPRVVLKDCHELKDITGLGNNHSVDLRYCERLKRVDNLASVPIVTIIGCAGIEDYSCLKNVPRLKILRTEGEEEDGNENEEEDDDGYEEYFEGNYDDEEDDERDDEGNDGENDDF